MMIIARNDEEKRNKIYKIATLVSTILIIVIAIYFLTRLFTVNPLEGKWEDEDGNLNISIESNGKLVAEILDIAEETGVEVEMKYTLDKDSKTISISLDEEVIQEIAEESNGQYTPEMLENALSMITTTFNYSVEPGELTLTEREYGEQMIFLEK
ncbi:MAG: hypothetical protein ACI4UH_05445 [Dorea sp.]